MKKISILALAVTITGCASIIDGTSQDINLLPSISEKVPATVVTSDGEQKVTLPAVIHTGRSKKNIVVKVDENACYEGSTQTVQSSMDPTILGNLITGGLFGSSTDFATGAAWEYDKSTIIHVTKKDTCQSK